MFSRILAPLDGSQAATERLQDVGALCRYFSADLVLLTVIDTRQRDTMLVDLPTGPVTARGETTDVEDLEERVRIYLNRALVLLSRAGINVSGELLDGDVDATILRAASEHECDLIALSPSAQQTSRRLLVGSVTEHVVHSSDVPIIVVKDGCAASFSKGEKDESRKNTVLVPLDGSRDAEAPLGFASSLAAFMGADLKLASVIPPTSERGDAGELDLEVTRTDISDYLDRLARVASSEGNHVDTEVAFGDPASEFIKIAEQNASPIIVMSTRRYSAASKRIVGSFTDQIMRRTSHPMFAVPRDR